MKEDQLHDIWTINQSFARARDMPAVLDVLAIAVIKLVPRADMVILYLYDEKRKVLRLGAGVGVVVSSLKRIAFKPGESMTGQVFVSKQPVLCMAEQDVKEKMANISSDNMRWYRQGVADKQIRSSFSVPLLSGSRCLGTLAVNQHKEDVPFTEKEVRLVAQLAVQGAFAIDNARAFEQMAAHARELNESLMVQERFTQVLAEGGGIEKVLTVLCRLLPAETKAAFSETNVQTDCTYPVLQGSERIGWLVFNRTVTTKDRMTIEKAAEAIAIVCHNEMNRRERDLRMKGAQFGRILKGASIEEADQLFAAHRDKGVRCLVFEQGSSGHGYLCQKLERIALDAMCEATVVTHGSYWVVVLNASEEKQVESFCMSVQTLPELAFTPTIGVSRLMGIHEVVDAYVEALEAWKQGEAAAVSIAYYVKLGYKRLLNRLDLKDKQAFIQDHLGPLLVMEPVYEETLTALIKHNRNRQQAADALYIHPNTLYQRVKKIEQGLGVSFAEEAVWMNIVIAVVLNNDEKTQ